MRDYKMKSYKVKMKVEISFDSNNYIYATDELDARAKVEMLSKNSIEYAFNNDINLKPLLGNNDVYLKFNCISVNEDKED